MLDQILQELYIGKTPELLEVEKLIGNIRRSNTMGSFLANPTYNKDMQRINRIFEDFFGFEVFSLMVDRSTAANAYTMPISIAIDIAPQYRIRNNLLATDKGFKYKKEAGYCCVVHIFNSLLFDDRITDAEIVAIILHEIGHNFETVINEKLYYTSDTVNVLWLVTKFISNIVNNPEKSILNTIAVLSLVEIITSNKFKKIYDRMLRIIEKDPNLRIIFGMASLYLDCVKELNMNINYIKSEVFKYGRIPQILKNVIIRKIGKPFGATSENVADSFATIYGYGPDLASAMLKFSSNSTGPISQRIIYSIPVISQIVALYDLPLEILVSVLDEHPSGIERATLAKANLQRELKNSYIDPRMKSYIQKQINEIDDAISNYEAAAKRIDNPKAFRAMWDIFLYNLKGSSKSSNSKSMALMGNIDDVFVKVKLK